MDGDVRCGGSRRQQSLIEGGVVDSSSTFFSKQPMRSKLFVPGSRPELFAKALAGAADALAFDLEDAVVRERKSEAREAVAAFLRRHMAARDKLAIVRVNGSPGELFLRDIEAVVGAGLDIINLPKVESRDDILKAVDAIAKAEERSGLGRQVGILANIETPRGLRLAFEIATADPRVMGLQAGFMDFSLACGMTSQNKNALNAVRFAVRCASAEAGIAAFDTAFGDVKDSDAFRDEAQEARDLGFAGKSCVHPSQVPIANAVFSPGPEEIARAERILAAASEATERGVGAFVHEGQMIDNPVIAQARAMMTLAAKLGLAPER